MWLAFRVVSVVMAILAFRGVRWAYATFVLLALFDFPAQTGFHLARPSCELMVGARLAAFSLTNYPHIVLFAFFYLMTRAQLARTRLPEWSAFAWAGAGALVMGALVELGEGITGRGHCRLRDLIPDSAGVLLGTAVLAGWRRGRGYFFG